MSTGRPLELSEEEAQSVGSALKERTLRQSKRAGIAQRQPLKARSEKQDKRFAQAWRKTAGNLSEAEQREALERALEVFSQLPAQSTYARHRIQVLRQALQLLDKAAAERTEGEQGELQQLLQQLKL